METHAQNILTKQGDEWTNNLGQTFPAVPLYRAECSCGWHGLAWYATIGRAQGHYERHLAQGRMENLAAFVAEANGPA